MRWEEWRQRKAETFWAIHEAKEREWMLREDPRLKHEAGHPPMSGGLAAIPQGVNKRSESLSIQIIVS